MQVKSIFLLSLSVSLLLSPDCYAVGGRYKKQDSLQQAQHMALQAIKNHDYRFKVIAENMSNSDTTASEPGADPYRRKMVVFGAKNDPRVGSPTVQVKKVLEDKSDFKMEHNPSHPAADENGMVKKPNVNRVVESVDLMTARAEQKALLRVYSEATSMRRLQIDLMR